MTIEFHCPECDKLLRTPDDKAGVSAPCPSCGTLVTVPAASPEVSRNKPDVLEVVPDAEPIKQYSLVSPPGAARRAVAGADTTVCPMCGARVPIDAFHCTACGESLVPDQDVATGRPTRINPGDMLRRTWSIFTANPGTAIGGVVLALVLNQLVSLPWNLTAQRGDVPGLAKLLFFFLSIAGGIFFQVGQIILLVKMARGNRARVADIFSGYGYLWRALWASALFVLVLIPCMILFIIPAIFVALMFWPVNYVIVAEDQRILAGFGRARELTSGNRLSAFVLFLALLGVHIPVMILVVAAAAVAPFLGGMLLIGCFVVTLPFSLLLMAVTYTAMCGRPTADQLVAARSAT